MSMTIESQHKAQRQAAVAKAAREAAFREGTVVGVAAFVWGIMFGSADSEFSRRRGEGLYPNNPMPFRMGFDNATEDILSDVFGFECNSFRLVA